MRLRGGRQRRAARLQRACRGEVGSVSVSAEVGDRELVVLIADDGMGFSPRDDSPGLGLGMPLMSSLARTLEITVSEQGGALVRMTFEFETTAG